MADRRSWVDRLLASVESETPARSVAVLGRILEEELPLVEASFLITDLGGKTVIRLTDYRGSAGGGSARLPLPGTLYEQVLRSQQPWVRPVRRGDTDRVGAVGAAPGPAGTRVIAPVTVRGDPVGLLELVLLRAPDSDTLQRILEAAHAFGYVVVANRRFTDLYDRGQRTTRLSLASEIQHRLLPECFSCDLGPYAVAGSLEPAADVGGDTFDYTVGHDGLHLSLTDAMGHDVRAAQLATVVVGALRNARRAALDLAEQARAANLAVAEHAVREHRAVVEESAQVHHALATHGAQAMVTGQLLWIDLETGQNAFVNAGHVRPLRLREGRVEEVEPLVDLPFGVLTDTTYRVHSLDFHPGDRLLLITDGMVERNQDRDDLYRHVEATGGEHPRAAVQALTRAVLVATDHDPRDDATVLCLDWNAPRR